MCEAGHLVELLAVAALTPDRMVEPLPASSGVDPGRLQKTERIRADPDVVPCRRNRQAPHTLDDLWVLDPAAVLVQVGEPAPPANTAKTGSGAVRAPQPTPRPHGGDPAAAFPGIENVADAGGRFSFWNDPQCRQDQTPVVLSVHRLGWSGILALHGFAQPM